MRGEKIRVDLVKQFWGVLRVWETGFNWVYVGWVGGRLSWLVVRPICFGPGGMLAGWWVGSSWYTDWVLVYSLICCNFYFLWLFWRKFVLENVENVEFFSLGFIWKKAALDFNPDLGILSSVFIGRNLWMLLHEVTILGVGTEGARKKVRGGAMVTRQSCGQR